MHKIIDASVVLNPLNNYFFTTASSIIIIGFGWYITDKIIEPRLKKTAVDGDEDDLPQMEELGDKERRGLRASGVAFLIGVIVLVRHGLTC